VSGALVYYPEKGASLLQYWYLDEACLGQGLGRRLMAAYESLQRDTKVFRVWVRSHNRSAAAIYEHYGYKSDRLIDEVLIRRM
jgi:ribosomal protein S18 acetylase RimI-like enzyme